MANRFRELGAIILDADEYARRVAEPGTPSYAVLRALIGPQYFNPDGSLIRADLRRRIIQEPALRESINAILHPYITQAMLKDWEREKKLNPGAVIVFDVPLLFEKGAEKNFDIIILVYCTPEVQLQRLIHRDKLAPSEAERTLTMQLPIDFKRDRSDYIIENSGDLEGSLRQVDEVWEKIVHAKTRNKNLT